MDRWDSSDDSGRKEPVRGMSTQTFVRGYKRNSQMDVNTINGVRLSSGICDMLEELHGRSKKSNNTQA